MAEAVRDRLVTRGWLLAWRLVRVAPEPIAYRLFELAADVAARRRTGGAERLRVNLARVRPELDETGLDDLLRAGMRSYLRYWCDVFRLPGWSREDVLRRVRPEGDAAVRASLGQGRGVVMALAHQGNWDAAGAWGTIELGDVTTVAERLRPEGVYRRFLAFREQLGMEILPLTGGAAVFPTLLRRLRGPVVVPLLADRDLTSTGVEVDLCGQRARIAAGPAALALGSGAALHPVSITYRHNGTRAHEWVTAIHFHPEVHPPDGGTRAEKVAAMTQACADALGAGIMAAPQDWHMMQRVFTVDLDQSVLDQSVPAQSVPAVDSAQEQAR